MSRGPGRLPMTRAKSQYPFAFSVNVLPNLWKAISVLATFHVKNYDPSIFCLLVSL
jgi:hypothetical protein